MYLGGQVPIDLGTAVGWVSVVALVLGFLDIAVWLLAGTRLAAGAFLRLRPRPAWLLALVPGLSLIVVQLVLPVLSAWIQAPIEVLTVVGLVSWAGWIALALAFLAGLGRGRARRYGPPRRMRLFIVNPTD
jgi:hypothetical protein